MQARIVREELQKCQKAEGINHYQVCHGLAEKYLELLKDAKVSCAERGRLVVCGHRCGASGLRRAGRTCNGGARSRERRLGTEP